MSTWRTNLNAKQEAVAEAMRMDRRWFTTNEFRDAYLDVGGAAPEVRIRELFRMGLLEKRHRPNSGGQVEYRWKVKRVKPPKIKRVRPRRVR